MFVFRQKIEVETRWKINKPSKIYLSSVFTFFYESVLRKIKSKKVAGLDEIPARSMEDQGIRPHTAPTL